MHIVTKFVVLKFLMEVLKKKSVLALLNLKHLFCSVPTNYSSLKYAQYPIMCGCFSPNIMQSTVHSMVRLGSYHIAGYFRNRNICTDHQ